MGVIEKILFIETGKWVTGDIAGCSCDRKVDSRRLLVLCGTP